MNFKFFKKKKEVEEKKKEVEEKRFYFPQSTLKKIYFLSDILDSKNSLSAKFEFWNYIFEISKLDHNVICTFVSKNIMTPYVKYEQKND